ncbi:uncharacterized protein LOC125258476 isoform X2 [Megalobrama amblycephala]|nr:uncharacterized protein LOC125258476 isoform X2 [Megalobrama amblycephala]
MLVNENTVIAEINKQADRITVYDDVLDGRFRDRLKLNKQTGSLTITNTTMKHAEHYELQINSRRQYFFLTVCVEISVKEGDSVTLNSRLTEMKDDDVIQWKFGNYKNSLIAEINKWANNITVYDDVLDGRFRDRLKLDKQTGSLTITNITAEHTGRYTIYKKYMGMTFILALYDEISVKEGDSVTLNSALTEMKLDRILWTFGPEITKIAEINKQADRITVYDDVLDGRFIDRLKLDNQTGSLTITNITAEHTGYYLLHITGAKESLKAIRVSIYAVIRLVLSALVGVATVIILVYDIRSRRAEQDRAHIHTSGSIEI